MENKSFLFMIFAFFGVYTSVIVPSQDENLTIIAQRQTPVTDATKGQRSPSPNEVNASDEGLSNYPSTQILQPQLKRNLIITIPQQQRSSTYNSTSTGDNNTPADVHSVPSQYNSSTVGTRSLPNTHSCPSNNSYIYPFSPRTDNGLSKMFDQMLSLKPSTTNRAADERESLSQLNGLPAMSSIPREYGLSPYEVIPAGQAKKPTKTIRNAALVIKSQAFENYSGFSNDTVMQPTEEVKQGSLIQDPITASSIPDNICQPTHWNCVTSHSIPAATTSDSRTLSHPWAQSIFKYAGNETNPNSRFEQAFDGTEFKYTQEQIATWRKQAWLTLTAAWQAHTPAAQLHREKQQGIRQLHDLDMQNMRPDEHAWSYIDQIKRAPDMTTIQTILTQAEKHRQEDQA